MQSKDLNINLSLLFKYILIRQDDQFASSVVSLNDCIHILFHPINRHLILIVYPREILIFDLQILQTVGTITCEKNSAAFYKVCSSRQSISCNHSIEFRSMLVTGEIRLYVFMKVEQSVFGIDI